MKLRYQLIETSCLLEKVSLRCDVDCGRIAESSNLSAIPFNCAHCPEDALPVRTSGAW